MTSFIVKSLFALVLLLGAAGGLAWAADPAHGADPALQALLVKRAAEGERNRVLNSMVLGLAALQAGDHDLARSAFDDALNRIESTHGQTAQAQHARQLWYEEGCKDFKGEPYERAMAYYYRGVIALMDRDFDNARACFNAGILQAEYGEEERYRCCFALLYLLNAYSCHLQGDLAARDEQFQQVKALRPDFHEPDWSHSFLVLVETGRAPRKLADGVGHYELKLFRGKGFTDVNATVAVGGISWPTYPAEDVAFQAMTRGGRPIDAILAGKVKFKDSLDGAATTLTAVSSQAMLITPAFRHSGEASAVVGGVGLLGVASELIAQNVKPRADTRCWSNLPDTIHVVFLAKAESPLELTVSFLAADGSSLNQAQLPAIPGSPVVWIKNHEL